MPTELPGQRPRPAVKPAWGRRVTLIQVESNANESPIPLRWKDDKLSASNRSSASPAAVFSFGGFIEVKLQPSGDAVAPWLVAQVAVLAAHRVFHLGHGIRWRHQAVGEFG